MKISNQKGVCALLVWVLATTGCAQKEDEELQKQSEQVTAAYQKALEAEGKTDAQQAISSEYKLPTRSDDPEPILTVKDVQAMTTPEQLAKALVAPDAAVRLAAIQGLNAFAANLPDAALQRLINMLDAEKDPTVVPAVAQLLAKSCHPAVMVVLLNNLKRDGNNVNLEAVKVLGDAAGYRAVEGIEQLLARLDETPSPQHDVLRAEAESAKNKILARNGRPLVCAW
jgi:hypothetical protein